MARRKISFEEVREAYNSQQQVKGDLLPAEDGKVSLLMKGRVHTFTASALKGHLEFLGLLADETSEPEAKPKRARRKKAEPVIEAEPLPAE